jgi:hypothetical protein
MSKELNKWDRASLRNYQIEVDKHNKTLARIEARVKAFVEGQKPAVEYAKKMRAIALNAIEQINLGLEVEEVPECVTPEAPSYPASDCVFEEVE